MKKQFFVTVRKSSNENNNVNVEVNGNQIKIKKCANNARQYFDQDSAERLMNLLETLFTDLSGGHATEVLMVASSKDLGSKVESIPAYINPKDVVIGSCLMEI